MTPQTQLSSAMCSGCQQRLAEHDPAPCSICGRQAALEFTQFPKRSIIQDFTNWMLKPLGWFTHTLTVLLTLAIISSLIVKNVVELEWSLLIAAGILGISVIWISRLLFWLFYPQRPRTGWRFLIAPALLGLCWLGEKGPAINLAFSFSRSALEATAKQKASQRNLAGPLHAAGLYPVRYIQKSGNNVRIIVAKSNFLDTNYAGFAKCPRGCGVDEFPLPPGDSRATSPTEYQHLKDDWYWFKQTGRFD